MNRPNLLLDQPKLSDLMARESKALLLKAFQDVRLIGLLVCAVVLGMGLILAVVLPALEDVAAMDRRVIMTEKRLKLEKQDLADLKSTVSRLKRLPSVIRTLRQGESPSVVADNLAQGILRTARNVSSPVLAREVLGLTPKSQTLRSVKAMDSALPGLPLNRYRYDVRVRGTYPALADLLNQLVRRHQLVVIDQVAITRAQTGKPVSASVSNPGVSVPLEMLLSFSVYLHDPSQSPWPEKIPETP